MELRKAQTVKVHRVVCAVDVGRVVNPTNIIMQSESAIVYGLSSAALRSDHTIAKGRVRQELISTTIRSCVWTPCLSSKLTSSR